MPKRLDKKGRVLRSGESQRKDSTYMYRYTDKWGRRHCIYAPTLQILREKEKSVIVNDVNGVNTYDNTTLAEMSERAYQLYAHKKHNTARSVLFFKNLVSRYPIANKRLRDIVASETKMWLMDLVKEGYSSNTIHKTRFFCRYLCILAIEDNIIIKNPFDYKPDFLPPAKKRVALTDEEQASFFAFLEEYETEQLYKDFILVLIETGLRFGEFRGLTRNDIDLQRRIINVDHQLVGGGPNVWRVTEPKTKTSTRKIPISNRAYDALERLYNREEVDCSTITVDGHTAFIALGKLGSIISEEVLCSNLKKICERYAQTTGKQLYITPHILRHTFCTNMCNRGLSAISLQYLMGHSNLTTTFNVYCHSNCESAIKEFNALFVP